MNKIVKENHIPEDVRLMSDSGWELDATDMDGVYYNEQTNTIVFGHSSEHLTDNYVGWKILNY